MNIRITVPGKYLAIAYLETGNTDNLTTARLWASANVIAEQQGHGSYLQHICFFGIADMQADTDFAITAFANSSTSTKKNLGLVAIRIG